MKLPALLLFASAVSIGQTPPAMPAWLAAYPGASPDTRAFPSLTESTYQTAAAPARVVEHYAKLFDGAGLTFNPVLDGMGTAIRSTVPECDLLIKIREQGAGAFVRVSCAVKTPAMVAVAAAPPPPPREPGRRTVEEAEEAGRKRLLEMEKYDQPVAPRSRVALAWPAWLVRPEGAPPSVKRSPALDGPRFLTSSFTTAADSADVHAFYTDLFESHQCSASSQGKAWLEYACGRTVVRAELARLGAGTQVDLRVTVP